jgi:hypothetical protein
MAEEFRLLKSEVLPLTRALAEEWRDLTPSPTERELNPHRMKHLREKADASHLVTFHWAKALFDGKPVRVNGQHSANVLCELDGNFPANLMAHIDEYQVDTIDGLAMLFRQFDDRTSGRSPSDVAGAYQNLYPVLRDVKKPVGKLGIQGVVWYRRHVLGDPGVPSGDDRYKLFNVVPLQQFLLWLNEILGIKTPELKREPVIAAVYATFIANEREARPFWETVARGGTDYDEDEPTTVLDTWLKEAKEDPSAEKIKPAKYYQACIYAWNASREHKQIKAIKVDTKKTMLTPHAD